MSSTVLVISWCHCLRGVLHGGLAGGPASVWWEYCMVYNIMFTHVVVNSTVVDPIENKGSELW